MTSTPTLIAEIEKEYLSKGWKRVQMGETIIFEKAPSPEVIASIKEADQQRRAQPLWRRIWRIWKKIVLLQL
jgi:hypothetical protein